MENNLIGRMGARLSALALALVLAACGGGGGGDSGAAAQPGGAQTGGQAGGQTGGQTGGTGGTGGQTGGTGATPPAVDNTFAVSLPVTELKLSGEEGAALAPAYLRGAVTGNVPKAVYAGGQDLNAAIDRVQAEVQAGQLSIAVYAKDNLAAGTYKGQLKLFACPDQQCTTNFAGSPVTVPYTVVVARGFKVTPGTVALSALSGASATADVAVQVPAGQTVFKATSQTSWLTVSATTATGFTLKAAPMPPGSYTGSVDVNTGASVRSVQVVYTVTGNQSTVTKIIPSAESFAFKALSTGTSPAQTLDVTLPSWTTELNATVSYPYAYGNPSDNWLTLTRTGNTRYTLAASAQSLKPGTYNATVQLTSGNLTSPVAVPVTFTVGDVSWAVSGTRAFVVDKDTTAAKLAADLTVDIPGLAPVQWSAASNAAWLKLATTSGTTRTTHLKASVDQAELIKLANGASYTADVTLTAPASANGLIAPTKVTFTLNKAVPEVHYVSPSTRLPNEAGTYTLRGIGFDRIANIAQVLRVNGATPLAVTHVSDTELAVKLPGAASGAVTFSIDNALGLQTGAPQLQVAAPATYAYQALDTAGRKGGIAFDPVRNVIYTANATLGAIMRFSYDGAAWAADSVALPGADMVSMSPDRKLIVATSTTTNSIVLLDPATLAVKGTYKTTYVGADGPYVAPRLAVMNDGRAFFEGIGGEGGGIGYFDLYNRRFGGVPGGSGSWFSVSGDGSHLLIVQSASYTPAPPMLYLNTMDSSAAVNPAGIDFWYDAAQSLHGERFVADSLRVRDRDFALIGNLTIPAADNYYPRASVLSPDGNRTYVLAYPSYNGPADAPRIYVFDSSTRVVTTTDLPLLGYFPIADQPSCGSNYNDSNCIPTLRLTASPDGKTLFILGDQKLVVTPIPALTAAASGGGARTGRPAGLMMRQALPRR